MMHSLCINLCRQVSNLGRSSGAHSDVHILDCWVPVLSKPLHEGGGQVLLLQEHVPVLSVAHLERSERTAVRGRHGAGSRQGRVLDRRLDRRLPHPLLPRDHRHRPQRDLRHHRRHLQRTQGLESTFDFTLNSLAISFR